MNSTDLITGLVLNQDLSLPQAQILGKYSRRNNLASVLIEEEWASSLLQQAGTLLIQSACVLWTWRRPVTLTSA